MRSGITNIYLNGTETRYGLIDFWVLVNRKYHWVINNGNNSRKNLPYLLSFTFISFPDDIIQTCVAEFSVKRVREKMRNNSNSHNGKGTNL